MTDPVCEELQSKLSPLLDGELAPGEAARLEAHGRACAVCGPLLRTLRATLRLCANQELSPLDENIRRRLHARLERELNPPLTRPRARWRLAGWRWRPWAAASALLVVMIFGVMQRRSHALTTAGWLVDRHCLAAVRAHPGDHPRSCLLKCASYGYGVLNPQGKFLVFDSGGNRSAEAALAASSQMDHIWVAVRGRATGDTLAVEDLRLEPPETSAASIPPTLSARPPLPRP